MRACAGATRDPLRARRRWADRDRTGRAVLRRRSGQPNLRPIRRPPREPRRRRRPKRRRRRLRRAPRRRRPPLRPSPPRPHPVSDRRRAPPPDDDTGRHDARDAYEGPHEHRSNAAAFGQRPEGRRPANPANERRRNGCPGFRHYRPGHHTRPRPAAPSNIAPRHSLPTAQSEALAAMLAGSTASAQALDFYRIPLFLLPIYQAAAVQYGVPWQSWPRSTKSRRLRHRSVRVHRGGRRLDAVHARDLVAVWRGRSKRGLRRSL